MDQQQQQQHQVNIPNAYPPPPPPHQSQQQTQTPQPNLINPQQQQQQPNIPIAYPPPLHQSQQQTLTQTQTPQPNLTNPQQQQQPNIPNAYPQPLHQSQQTQTQTPLPNLPLGSLIKGSREQYIRIGIPLYEASIKGDWKVAEAILKQCPDLVRSAITENYETPLHIASSAKSTKSVETFVENLVKLMDKKDMELQNKNENTALSLAAAAGYVKMADIMVQKNSAVPEIPGSNRMMPLYVAALFGKQDMVRYLYKKSKMMTGRLWTDQNRSWVLEKCVESDLFDVALEIASDRPELTTNPNVLRDVLSVLARKTAALSGIKPNTILGFLRSLFAAEKESKALELLKHIWERTAIMPTKTIDDIIRGPALAPKIYPSRVLFVAAKMGNKRFIIELIRLYPDLIWKKNHKELTIFHVAVKRRHENIYNLLYEIGSMKDLITPIKDKDGNTMLHLIGKSAKPKRWKTVSGVALQMQRELLWYQEVEQMIPPSYKERKNKDGKTPYELFTEKHLELVKDGADWMKETAAQCMVVAALIATIVFVLDF